MLLFRWIETERYSPAGKKTVPPPALAAASIVLLIAAVSSVLPLPVAPKAFTLKAAATRAPSGTRCALVTTCRDCSQVSEIIKPRQDTRSIFGSLILILKDKL